MSILYHCPHLTDPAAPLSPSHASSSSSLSPLDALYFCEECDAIRCNTCVATEIASYYCPSCLFDVPSANVRGDKNRCARHCFACPSCGTFTEVQGTTTAEGGPLGGGPPFVLVCKGCRWTSREAGIEFERNTGVAVQLQKQLAVTDTAQAEFDALKDHLEGYMAAAAPVAKPRPTRHISHLAQTARRAPRRVEAAAWDELAPYVPKGPWGGVNDSRCVSSWYSDAKLPQRVPLLAKLTKRCPHPDCRHLLIQPDLKSSRYKIKMVAASYVPTIELGRRRRRLDAGSLVGDAEEVERRRRERRRVRREEVDEDMAAALSAGQVYTYQLAFTNASPDAIQIRLGASDRVRIHIPSPHFTVAPPKDAWAYDDQDDADDNDGSEDGSVATRITGSASMAGTLSKRSRVSVLGSVRDKKRKEADVEKKGNVTKVVVEVEVHSGQRRVEADFEVRLTYRVDEDKEYKTFTFWVRAHFGNVV